MSTISGNRTAAIIAAAGSGRRMNCAVAKQYLRLSGIPVIVHAMSPFEKAKSVDEIVLVVPIDDVDFVKQNIVRAYGFEKITHVLSGGEKRQDSVMEALRRIGDEVDVVVIHDGARPFVETGHIDMLIREARSCGAVVTGIPITDTIKMVNGEYRVTRTIDRTMLWQAQTPQAFDKNLIMEAYTSAYKNGFYGTDDASLVERIGIEVRMVCGTLKNIKITTEDDFQFALQLIGENRGNR